MTSYVRLLLPLMVAVVMIETSRTTAFVASSFASLPSSRLPFPFPQEQPSSIARSSLLPLSLSNRENHEEESIITDHARRAFVLLATSISAIVPTATATTASSVANAADPNKIVLSTYTSPPTKYPELSTTTSSSSTLSTTTSESTSATPSTTTFCTDEEERRILIFERAAPSVVFIDTFTQQRDAFSTNVLEVPLGSGSGFVWDDKGHIVTNYHVVRDAKSAQVAILTRVFDNSDNDRSITSKKTASSRGGALSSSSSVAQRQKAAAASREQQQPLPTSMRPSKVLTDYKRSVYKAKVIGVDPSKDIAVLKVDAPVYDLYPIDLGSSASIRVGQTALAIGNPFGLDHSMTAGIISGIGREVRSPIGQPISNVLQTDAAINPGNSGGPLLDSSGKIIGMNTAIYSPSGGSAGIGFAIPIDTVSYIVQTLIRDGKIIRPVIGISYLQTKQARALGISKGVLVLDVPKDSPAYRAGMKGTRRTESGLIEIGDIIVKVAETDIDTEADLFTALENYKPGDRVKIVVNRLEPSGGSFKAQEIVLSVQLKASESQAISFGNGDASRYHD